MTGVDRYLRIVRWARLRYTRNGYLVISAGGKPSVYSRIEIAAWSRHVGEVGA